MDEEIHRISFHDRSSEIMVQYPNGSVKFIGTWAMVKLFYTLLRNKKIVYVNGEKI